MNERYNIAKMERFLNTREHQFSSQKWLLRASQKPLRKKIELMTAEKE